MENIGKRRKKSQKGKKDGGPETEWEVELGKGKIAM